MYNVSKNKKVKKTIENAASQTGLPFRLSYDFQLDCSILSDSLPKICEASRELEGHRGTGLPSHHAPDERSAFPSRQPRDRLGRVRDRGVP